MPTVSLFDKGDTILVTVCLRDSLSANALVDPGTLSFTLDPPNDVEVTYVYGTDMNVVRIGTGKYYCQVTGDQSGVWTWKMSATSPVVVKTGTFSVALDPTAS